ncbi:MAG: transglutaminase domain-containing protein, partial [Planctomycetes bacterium]|nr:transglutaminase domain-containing protein [Planctomycetota bacterium]
EPRLTRNEEERTTTRTWTVGRTGRIEREPAQPPLREIGPTLQVSTYATWQEFGTWYANLIRHQSEPDDAIRAKVEDLTQGCTNEQEILQALYGFVANGIEYRAWEFGIHGWNPYTASQVLSNGFGDCKDKANLLATMLRLKGIDACPVLIHSEEEGRAEEDLTLPLIEHFNHCIARARLADGRTLWLDGTAQDHPWDALPDMDQGATVFVVTPDGGSIERLPERAAADCACEASFDAVVGEDLAAVVEVRIHATGTRGAILRNVLNVEGHRQEILENLHGRRFPGCRVELGAFPDLDDLSAPVDLRYTLRIPGLLRPDGPSRWRLPLLEDFFLMDTFSDMAQLPDREHDLLLGPPWQSTTAATVRLPPSLSFASPGACAEILEPAAECRLTRETPSPTLLRMEQRVSFLASRIRRGDYAAFRSACNRADEARRAEPVIERARAE